MKSRTSDKGTPTKYAVKTSSPLTKVSLNVVQRTNPPKLIKQK